MKVDVNLRIDPAAVGELKRVIESSGGDESVVRIVAQGGGCSGGSFGLTLVNEGEIDPEVDVVDDFGGLKVVVDKKSLFALDGALIEWVDGETKGFRFNAPSSKSSCGCKKGGSCKSVE